MEDLGLSVWFKTTTRETDEQEKQFETQSNEVQLSSLHLTI